MKVLMLSTDKNIFDSISDAHQRMIGYGGLFDELHIIVYTNANAHIDSKVAISKNTFAYPTKCSSRLFYFRDAYIIAKNILKNFSEQDKLVVTAQDPFETGLVGYFLKRKFSIPLNIQIHTDFLSPYFWKESLKNKIRVLLGKWIIRRADVIRAVSNRIKKSLVDFYPEIESRIVILPIFVEIEKIRAMIIQNDLHKKYPQFKFIILMASRLTVEKNISMAIDAMRSVVNKCADAGLVIVGDGPERSKLNARIISHGLQKNVILERWIDDLSSYYKTADCFALTSNYEGYGRTVVEAMAAGCPVVMTDVGIAGDLITDEKSGLIVPVNDAENLAKVFLRLQESAVLGKILSEGAFGVIDTMISKDRYFAEYKSLLENI